MTFRVKSSVALAFVLLIPYLCAPWAAEAQSRTTLSRQDIPHLPVDTLPTDRRDVLLVTFTDGTFRFIAANPWHFRAAEAYGVHWDTVNLFAYRSVELSDLPEQTPLTLCDSAGMEFRAPVSGRVLSKYGRRNGSDHNGTDIKVEQGQPVYAAFDGIVRWSRWNSGGYGNLVIIRHRNGLETYYAHLSRRAVRADEWVRAGQVIGYGGRTGRASTTHLHFETRYCDQSFDPERLVDFAAGKLLGHTVVLRKEYFSIRSRAVEGIEEDAAGIPVTDSGSASADTLAGQSVGVASGTEPLYHTVERGDNLWTLARRYDTTVARICELSGITRSTIIKPGKILRVK